MRLLIGDIGGTNTRLQLIDVVDNNYQVTVEKTYSSQEYGSLENIIHHFLALPEAGEANMACLAIAGPVKGKQAKVTNLPWHLDCERLQTELAIPQVYLINDFEAIGYGVPVLADKDMVVLQKGNVLDEGNMALIGAGTGLGEALLAKKNGCYITFPTEGGHVDFAPTNALQVELLQYLQKRHPHVSYEMILSGPGLVSIYQFLCDKQSWVSCEEFLQRKEKDDLAALISEYALLEKDKVAMQSLACFIDIYAAQAGNVALNFLATGGVYLAGGIAPKIINQLSRGSFLEIFRNKGKMTELMASIPVKVIMNEQVGLLGAIQYALSKSGKLNS